jgi:hypothetical protein
MNIFITTSCLNIAYDLVFSVLFVSGSEDLFAYDGLLIFCLLFIMDRTKVLHYLVSRICFIDKKNVIVFD